MNEKKFEEQIAQLDIQFRQKLTRPALERYGNIKAAHPEKTIQLLVLFAQSMQTKPMNVIDDNTLKQWLIALSQKKEIKIKRK